MIGLFLCALLFVVGQASTLYGIVGPTVGLSVIDPRTGFSKNETTELEGQQLSSLDPKNKLMYLVAYDINNKAVTLLGLDLVTGNQVYNVPLPFEESSFVGVGQVVQVNPNTGDVFVCGKDASTGGKHHILRVTPNSGSKTSIAVIGDVDVIGGISGYDPKNNVLWIEFGTGKSVSSSLLYLSLSSLSLFRFNLNNGTQSSIPNNLNMETMDYDPVSGLMVGVGLQVVSPTNYFRVFLTLDSANNKWNVVGKIPGYFIIRAGQGALDSVGRKYYSILQPVGKSTNPFQLVQWDMNANKILTHPIIGDYTCSLCPWSIHFLS